VEINISVAYYPDQGLGSSKQERYVGSREPERRLGCNEQECYVGSRKS
jgi:hypothetical protein